MSANGEPPGSNEDGRPVIAGAVVASIRRLLVQRGEWSSVHAALRERHPDGLRAVGPRSRWSAVDLDAHIALLEAIYEVLGEDELRSLGRQRLAGDVRQGIFATIARSWMRSFAQPEQLLRVGPYMWRAVMRNCGTMKLVASGDTFVRFRIHEAPTQLHSSRPWQALMEGLGLGLLDLARVPGDVRVGRSHTDAGAVEGLLEWNR